MAFSKTLRTRDSLGTRPAQTKSPLTRAPASATPGSTNPAASLSTKVVKRILDLEFVEMSKVTVDADLPQGPDHLPAPVRHPVTDISQWLERFSLMAAILTTRFPDNAPELFAFQAMIVRAEHNYKGKGWVSYDRQFRRETLARKDLNWSVTDPRLYNEAFTGRALCIARCQYWLQDDHTAAYCPRGRPQGGLVLHARAFGHACAHCTGGSSSLVDISYLPVWYTVCFMRYTCTCML